MVKNIVIGALALALLVSLLFHLTRSDVPPVAPVVVMDPPSDPDPVPPALPEPLPVTEPEPDPRLLAFEAAFDSVAGDPGRPSSIS